MSHSRYAKFVQFLAMKPRAFLSIPSIRKIKGYTMQTIAGVYQMEDHIKILDRKNIKGAIVETGSWKGGLGAYMARFGRETWLFDSFEGLPELSEKDFEIAKQKNLDLHTKTGYIAVSEEYAINISKKLGTKPHIIKGWFENTLPANKKEIGEIALLRLDGDTYDSTLDALNELYGSVVPGGIIVVDDYHDFSGCRKALYDFFYNKGLSHDLIQYPFGRMYFYK